ncbi:MAG: hypothetical protein M9887_03470 [Chitinophagales bacterium]|nr:hypothetical protein [Chitinophagales bacterium]
MISRVFGAALLFLSSAVMLFIFFLYLNSSAHFDYNAPKVSLVGVHLFYPLMVTVIVFVFGIILVKDHEIEAKELIMPED